jgi:O-antigen/teichoic acid export membrane protein
MMLSFTGVVFTATITSNKRFDLTNYLAIGIGVLTAVGIFAVLGLTKASFYGWAGVSLGAQILLLFLRHHVAHRIWPSLDICLAHFRKDALRPLFSLGGYLFAFKMTNLLSVRADPIIITSFFGPAGIALYNPGASLSKHSRPLVRSLAAQLHPLATAYHVTGKTQQLQAVLLRGTRYTLLMGIPVCVVLGIFAMPIMRLWLGSERFLGAAYRIPALVMTGWAVVDFLAYAAGTQWPVLLGMNRLKFLVWTQVPAGILNLLVSIILVGYTSLGIPGIMVATVIIAAIRRPIITVYAARACGMSAGRYFMESYLRPILVLALVASVGLALRIAVAPSSLIALAACVAGVGCLWAPLCWWIGFNPADRESFRGLLRRGDGPTGPAALSPAPVSPAGGGQEAVAETLEHEVADEILESEQII